MAALCLLLPALLAGCGGGDGEGAAAPGAGGDVLRPRVSAEHPVTSAPAREAGLLEDGALDGGGVEGDEREGGEGRAVWIVLPATDLEASLDFYRGLLAFEVVASEPAEPPYQRVELLPPAPAAGTLPLRLVLVEAEALARRPFPPAAGAGEEDDGGEGDGGDGDGGEGGGERSGGAVPAWPVADLAAVAERLEGAGVATREQAAVPGRRALAVADPAGNRLLLLEPDRP